LIEGAIWLDVASSLPAMLLGVLEARGVRDAAQPARRPSKAIVANARGRFSLIGITGKTGPAAFASASPIIIPSIQPKIL
jgi:hypothetical protein